MEFVSSVVEKIRHNIFVKYAFVLFLIFVCFCVLYKNQIHIGYIQKYGASLSGEIISVRSSRTKPRKYYPTIGYVNPYNEKYGKQEIRYGEYSDNYSIGEQVQIWYLNGNIVTIADRARAYRGGVFVIFTIIFFWIKDLFITRRKSLHKKK